MPAGTLICAWCRQVVTGSPHASTAYVHRPVPVGVTVAPQRSVPGASSRIGVNGPGRPSGSRSTTLAATASCPSRNTVAVTSNDSPTTAFAGRRPCRTSGRTSSTGMRPTEVSGGAGEAGVLGTDGAAGSVREGRPRGGAVSGRKDALAPDGEGDDEWCLAGMTAPVRVNEGGLMTVGRWVLRGLQWGVPAGAFPHRSGGQSGRLLTTHAYVDTQDRPRPSAPGGSGARPCWVRSHRPPGGRGRLGARTAPRRTRAPRRAESRAVKTPPAPPGDQRVLRPLPPPVRPGRGDPPAPCADGGA